MAGLSHFITSKASIQKYEPVFQNQFEVIITPPAAIPVPVGIPGNGNILLEQVISLTGFIPDKNPGEAVQKYKNAKRYYAGALPINGTTMDLGISFEVNLDSSNSMYVFKTLRQWSDLIYNPLTGAMGLKKDYTGTIVIKIFDKEGIVFRQVTCKDAFLMKAIDPMALDYKSTSLYKINVTWAVDYWDDIWI